MHMFHRSLRRYTYTRRVLLGFRGQPSIWSIIIRSGGKGTLVRVALEGIALAIHSLFSDHIRGNVYEGTQTD